MKTRRKPALASVLLLSCVAILGACAAASAPSLERDAESVLATQAQRFAAMVAADAAMMRATMAEDLVYQHSNGVVDSRASLVDKITSGTVDYLGLTARDSQVRLYADVAVITGTVDLHVAAGGEEYRFAMLFTEVYKLQGDGWKLVSWQSTALP